MWHATYTHINWGDSWLLVVGSQIDSLIRDYSFGHNLCFKYSNWSCEIILNMYVPRAFQWYTKLFNPMSFDPCNCPLKIWKSVRTSTPKVRVDRSVNVHSLTFLLLKVWNVTPKIHFWLTPLQALILIVSPRPGLRHIIQVIHELKVEDTNPSLIFSTILSKRSSLSWCLNRKLKWKLYLKTKQCLHNWQQHKLVKSTIQDLFQKKIGKDHFCYKQHNYWKMQKYCKGWPNLFFLNINLLHALLFLIQSTPSKVDDDNLPNVFE
jgi:hypothetical protein